jgi:hypothetical protein
MPSIPPLVVNILLSASIAIAIVAGWIWATGSFVVSIPAVAGLAVAAAGASVAADWLIRHTVHALRRRTRPPRHRRSA